MDETNPDYGGAVMREKRKTIWIDGFQTRLSLRIAFYFGLYQLAVWALVTTERNVFTRMEAVYGGAGFGLIALMTGFVIFLGLLFIYDAVKFTHRFVGPLYRFRKTIRAITAREEVELVNLRQTDSLQEMKDELNDMLKVLEECGAVTLKEEKSPAHTVI
jgi:hypothetical protein